MLFDVPFLSDGHYCELLVQNQERIHSLHLSIATPRPLDSRAPITRDTADRCIEFLLELPRSRKYLLLNSRFYHPAMYRDGVELRTTVQIMDRLLGANCLDGLLVADFYLLQTLSRYAPETVAALEAVPSINCMIDSFDRLTAFLEIITRSRFKSPTKCVLDRSLNRDMGRLRQIANLVRASFPGMKIELIANEGCLLHCPFKPAHDAQIAFANLADAGADIFRLNSEVGCVGLLQDRPEALFRSPFIRPEDIGRYEGLADIIKICGRTLGGGFLSKAVGAYLAGAHTGNLLELMDTLEWLSHRLHVANEAMPPDFLDRLTNCTGQCAGCSYCRTLFTEHVCRLPLHLQDLRTR